MTDQQLTERIEKLEKVNAAEIGCRAGELLNLLREIRDLRNEVYDLSTQLVGVLDEINL